MTDDNLFNVKCITTHYVQFHAQFECMNNWVRLLKNESNFITVSKALYSKNEM